ncbi:M20/M25/M40 family metallo-hydrolase [Candidatus Berkelbacteria bacterium]|nr:M20/M25/M40 family metallo-hydrolase [Candidatus Berkelbacteria bacterium]
MTAVAKTRRDIVTLARQLIGFESTTGNVAQIEACLSFVEEYLSEVGPIHLKQYRSNGVPSVIAEFDHSKTHDLLMIGHLDVVLGSPEQYEPKIDGDRLIGRGANDMKGQVAALLVLMKNLATLDPLPNVAIALTFDEEVGGDNGAKYLVDREGYRPKFVITPDGGGDETWEIVHAEKGVRHVRVTCPGKAAHAAYSWTGENAVTKLLDMHHAFVAEFPPLDSEIEYWHPTCTLSKIEGGTSANSVPATASVTLDIRLVEAAQHDWVERLLTTHFPGCQIETLTACHPVNTPADHDEVVRFTKVLEVCTGQEPLVRHSHGASDLEPFARAGIPGIDVGIIGGDVHGPGEWASLDSLVVLHDTLYAFITNERKSQ